MLHFWNALARPHFRRHAPCAMAMAVFAITSLSFGSSSLRAQNEDPVAVNLHTIGKNAYDNADYPLAIDQWNKLLNEYPDYPARREIKFLVGQAWFKQKDYKQAATEFRELRDSIPVIASYRSGPALLVFLGFSEYSVAKETDDAANATALLQQAIASYESFFENFPNDDLDDQAHFFYGEALSQLNQISLAPELLDRAAASYLAVIEQHPQSALAPKALSGLGNCLEQSGKYDDALVRYGEFESRFPDDELRPAVALRAAETVLKLGLARQNSGDAEAARKYFDDAMHRFDSLAKDEKFAERDFALYRKAFCLQQLPDLQAAADAYAALVTGFPESRLATESTLNAGKFYFAASDLPDAEKWLNTVVANDPDGKAEATHWLCRIHLEKEQYPEALALATAATENNGGGSYRANLLMDAADALHEIPDRRGESIPRYRAIVEQYPTDPLAPKARYYAAYANMLTGKYEDAIDDAEKFKSEYAGHELMAATLQVLGDSALKVNDAPLAQSTFEGLIRQFPEDPSADWWKTRVGWALYLQDKNDDAVSWLSQALTSMKDPVSRSESSYVMGSCHFRNGNFEKAIDAFERALSENDARTDANQLRLLLARAWYQIKNVEKARGLALEVLANHPDGPATDEARYRLGEFEYELGNYPEAITQYSPVIESTAPTQFLPNALYGRAWAFQKSGDSEKAIDDFNRLIEEFGDSPNGRQALLGRAAARRILTQFDEAIADIDAFLATNPADADRWQAVYERGFCHTSMEKWDAAIADLSPLAADVDPANPIADNLLYELGWACKKLDNNSLATTTFESLADRIPDSPFAAEANFHVGEALYAQKDFAGASARYQKSLDGEPSDSVGERAAYKLAWCAFEQENWNEAHRLFKNQVERYREGPLHAVGLSMLAESLFQNKNHAEAVTAYKVAVPAVRTATMMDDSVRVLTPLHAAQSANQTGDHESALNYARSVVDEFPESEYRFAALFELGTAEEGLGKIDDAIATWQPVAEKSIDRIGARARSMIGEAFFKKGDYERAITEFKAVMYGYPTVDQKAEIDPWRAFSAYETARCYYVQVSNASGERRSQLIASAREWFQYLLTNFENDVLAADARKQLDILKNLK